jgi:hypothetical protein
MSYEQSFTPRTLSAREPHGIASLPPQKNSKLVAFKKASPLARLVQFSLTLGHANGGGSRSVQFDFCMVRSRDAT